MQPRHAGDDDRGERHGLQISALQPADIPAETDVFPRNAARIGGNQWDSPLETGCQSQQSRAQPAGTCPSPAQCRSILMKSSGNASEEKSPVEHCCRSSIHTGCWLLRALTITGRSCRAWPALIELLHRCTDLLRAVRAPSTALFQSVGPRAAQVLMWRALLSTMAPPCRVDRILAAPA